VPAPAESLYKARAATGRPWISAATRAHLLDMATHYHDDIRPARRTQRQGLERAEMLQRVLRLLLISGPDAQLH
jgi:hypothetical protein